MKTCGQCIIYTPDMYGKNCNGCSIREYEGVISPETIACGRYISRQDFLSLFSQNSVNEFTVHPTRPADNSASDPVVRYWAKRRDIITGEVIGILPYCPSCNMLTLQIDRCEYCGQPFISDRQAEEFFASEQTERKDCPFCGAKEAYHYTLHSMRKSENGYCSVCKTIVMDYPHSIKDLNREDAYKLHHEIGHRLLQGTISTIVEGEPTRVDSLDPDAAPGTSPKE